jgi:beta-lactamase superfamily II metal-dependent hydrolase
MQRGGQPKRFERGLAGTETRSIPPREDEFELSLIGPGYGECIVMHFGGGAWVVIDSCLNVKTRQPVALEYLATVGVDASAIRLIVATHWHDDHIRGLTEILRVADKARFVMSDALRSSEFATLVSLFEPRMMLRSSGVAELRKVYAHLEERGASATRATADRRIWKPAGKMGRELWSLAPSDRSIELTLREVASLFSDRELPNRRVPSVSPNHASVVLWGKVGRAVVLLGGDLEETADDATGWSAIDASTERPSEKASVFKVPHHGSSTGHSDDVWRELLKKDAIAVLTPFARGRTKLPTEDDITRLKSLAGQVLVTSNRDPDCTDWPPAVAMTLAETTAAVRDVEPRPGHIRLRRDASGTKWAIELFAGAVAA